MNDGIGGTRLVLNKSHLAETASRVQDGKRLFTNSRNLTADPDTSRQNYVEHVAGVTLVKNEISSLVFLNRGQPGQPGKMRFAQTAEKLGLGKHLCRILSFVCHFYKYRRRDELLSRYE